MAKLAARLWCEEEGQGLTEYALILILLSLVVITSMKNLASGVGNAYTATAQKVAALHPPDHEKDDRMNGYSPEHGDWQPALGSSSQAGSRPAESSSNSLSNDPLR